MDASMKVLFSVAFELLFVFNAVTLIMGLLRLRKSGAVLIAEKRVMIQIYGLLVFSFLCQGAFWCMFSMPNYYLFAMVSAFAALYPKVVASEGIFAYGEKENWFGFKSYPKGSVKSPVNQQRRKSLNVLMEASDKKQFVLKTTPTLWEEIQTHL